MRKILHLICPLPEDLTARGISADSGFNSLTVKLLSPNDRDETIGDRTHVIRIETLDEGIWDCPVSPLVADAFLSYDSNASLKAAANNVVERHDLGCFSIIPYDSVAINRLREQL